MHTHRRVQMHTHRCVHMHTHKHAYTHTQFGLISSMSLCSGLELLAALHSSRSPWSLGQTYPDSDP